MIGFRDPENLPASVLEQLLLLGGRGPVVEGGGGGGVHGSAVEDRRVSGQERPDEDEIGLCGSRSARVCPLARDRGRCSRRWVPF